MCNCLDTFQGKGLPIPLSFVAATLDIRHNIFGIFFFYFPSLASSIAHTGITDHSRFRANRFQQPQKI